MMRALMPTTARLLLAVLLLSVAGCRCTVDGPKDAGPEDAGPGGAGGGGGGGGTGGGGTGGGGVGGGGGATDAGFDAGVDAGFDAGVDAGFDAGTDAGFDAGVDAGFDAGVDAGFDAGVDAGQSDAGILGDVLGTVLAHGECQLGPVPLADVSLRLVDGGVATTQTDVNGRFRFDGVVQGPTQVSVMPPRLGANRPVLGSHQLPLDVRPNQLNSLTFYLASGCSGLMSVTSSTVSLQLSSAFYPCPEGFDVTIEVDPTDLVLPDGGLFAGSALVEVAAPVAGKMGDGGFDYSSILTMPGNMLARGDGGSVMLDTFGALELSITADGTGERLQIAPGETLRVVHRGLQLPSPGSVPGYFFDTVLGQWVQDGTVTAVDGGWAFQLSHLSWWNPDVPLASVSCVRGRVRRNGTPVPGASVIIYSQSGGGQALSLSAEGDGTFCTNARPAMSLWYSARVVVPGVAPVLDAVRSGFLADTADGGRSCATRSACVDVGDIDVVELPGVCISGRGADGDLPDGGFGPSPEPFALVGAVPAAAYGGRPVRCTQSVPLVGVQPNADGQFCASLPANGQYTPYTEPFSCSHFSLSVDAGPGQRCGVDGGCFEVGAVDLSCIEAFRPGR